MEQPQFSINLEDARFHARIGVADQERLVGNEFAVSLSVRYDAALFEEERLETTISYADLYDEVRDEMRREAFLLETVAARIAGRLRRRFPAIHGGHITITKLAAPITGLTGRCSVTLRF